MPNEGWISSCSIGLSSERGSSCNAFATAWFTSLRDAFLELLALELCLPAASWLSFASLRLVRQHALACSARRSIEFISRLLRPHSGPLVDRWLSSTINHQYYSRIYLSLIYVHSHWVHCLIAAALHSVELHRSARLNWCAFAVTIFLPHRIDIAGLFSPIGIEIPNCLPIWSVPNSTSMLLGSSSITYAGIRILS